MSGKAPHPGRALEQGREFAVRLTADMFNAAAESPDALFFYAGLVAAVMSHVAAAVSLEGADAIFEMVKREMDVECAKLERDRAH